MKKMLLPALLLVGISAMAQDAYQMNVQLKSGETIQYPVDDIDNITFTTITTPEPPVVTLPPVKIAIPTDFTTGWVQKVTYDGAQVAEVDLEYIKSVDKQMVVIYPCDAYGRAELSKGVSATGATVVWNTVDNTATVGAEGDAVATVYLVDGAIVTSYAGDDAVEATVAADLLTDKRDVLDRNTYKIVKVGTQYWMAENLRAKYFADGTAITCIADGDAAWDSNTTGAYLKDTDTDWVKLAGYLYNGYCVTSEHGIAPEGWEVPTTEQWTMLQTAGGKTANNFKSEAAGTWATGKTGTNLTGFNIVATGFYAKSTTGLQSQSTDCYIWGSTVSTSWLKVEGLCTFRVATANNSVVSGADDCHGYYYGHAIRCVRKATVSID